MKMAFVLAGLSLVSVAGWFSEPAMAQGGYRNDNPNMRNFYMARQQIQITDDAPAVNDMRTNPAANPAAAAAAAAAAPRQLPRAGFNSYYTPTGAGMTNGLPQVVNGVPKAPPVAASPLPRRGSGPTGQRATAKTMGPKTASAPSSVKAYKPYQTYPEQSAVGSSASGGGMLNSTANVKGSVLHWNRRRSAQF